ncbi:putative membrane protein [Wickerhamomyces ciferrii]|uniref:Membrane protein n=1 Tax=Wickerhamomyces ciferrii (strain ATCC 14091 / BCRC 22168 / CBS 111 / JCM 3599 / NBRC 0793 / NRRL Y-1031 F-60-10) TaxID=1206466 RepID=K0KQ67_WICCF|nr:uncharacterized protein BN7_3121 [Wickerhamomyces ciferrii]CCH43569.1 putative membrane protein [Wickerhamomyces ciferrii]
MSSGSLLTHKVTTTIALVLAIYGNFKYALVVFIYWAFLHILQISFVAQYFFPEDQPTERTGSETLGNILQGGQPTRLQVADSVGWHFTVFNILQFVWTLLFVNGHYIWSELFAILNFFNILTLYVAHKTYSIKNLRNYTLIHFSTAALPFSWLLYIIFWNGAVVVGSNSLAARIVANVFIWDFLLVPSFALIIYRDWAIGLSSAALQLALGLGQLFTKVFALQWIFAFIIAGLLFLFSVAVLSAELKEGDRTDNSTDAENAPLVNN